MITRLFFTVYLGPKRRSEALAVFLLCGPADTESGSGPAISPCRPPDVLFQHIGLFLIYFPPPYLAHCSRRRLLSSVAFLTSRKSPKSGGGCRRWCGCSPLFPRATDRRLPSTDAAPESPEAGWCDRLSRPADSWISRLFLRSLRPRSPLDSGLEPSYVNIVNLPVCMNLISEYLLNLFAALPATHRETAALSNVTCQFPHTHTHPTSLQPTYGGAGRGDGANMILSFFKGEVDFTDRSKQSKT